LAQPVSLQNLDMLKVELPKAKFLSASVFENIFQLNRKDFFAGNDTVRLLANVSHALDNSSMCHK
jgi:hypothetical protein